MKKKDQDSGSLESVPRMVSLRMVLPKETNVARRIGHAVGVTTAVVMTFSMGAVLTWAAVTVLWTMVGSGAW